MCLIIMAMQIRMSGLEFIAETVSNLKSPELRAFAAWLRQQPVTPRTAPLLSNLATLERVPEFAAARERIAVDIAFVQAAAAALTSHCFWHPTGPKLSYRDGTLFVSDLNPQVETRWRMSRKEMLALGWQCIRAAIRRQ